MTTHTAPSRPAPAEAPLGPDEARSSARRAGAALLLLLAVLTVRLLWQGEFTSYVRPGMAFPLALATAVLAVLGIFNLLHRGPGAHRRHDSDEDYGTAPPAASSPGHDGHDHAGLSPVSLLLVLPVVVLTLIAPGALSPANSASTAAPSSVSFHPAPLRADPTGVITVGVRDLLGWAKVDPSKKLLHRRIRVIAMASRVSDSGRRVRLSRYTITCCAADATAFSADATLPADSYVPAQGSWLELVGTWDGHFTTDAWPQLDGLSAQPVGQPAVPYEL